MSVPISGVVLLAGVDENGQTVLLKVNADGTVSGAGGGVTDHGALTGLADNDHPQYLLSTGLAAALASRSLAELGTRSHGDLQNVNSGDPHTQYALESALATVATSGSYNDLATKISTQENEVAASETTTSTSYTDLTTTGPSVTSAPGTAMNTLVLIGTGQLQNSGVTTSLMAISVAGDTPDDVNTVRKSGTDTLGAGSFRWLSALASGTLLRVKYRVSGGTGTFVSRRILSMPVS